MTSVLAWVETLQWLLTNTKNIFHTEVCPVTQSERSFFFFFFLLCDVCNGITSASEGVAAYSCPFFSVRLEQGHPSTWTWTTWTANTWTSTFPAWWWGTGVTTIFGRKCKQNKWFFVKSWISLILLFRRLQWLGHKHWSPPIWYQWHPCRCCDLSVASIQVGVAGSVLLTMQMGRTMMTQTCNCTHKQTLLTVFIYLVSI